MTSARALLATCIAKGLRVTAAESCTGGMVMAALTDIAGSSAVVDRGYVTYSNQAKIEMLGVQPGTLEAVGAVSEDVAREMAQGALDHSGADLAVSVTGIAGPGGSDFKPEGRVCFAIATHQGCTAETVEFGPLGRENVREAARNHGLALLNKAASAH